MKPLPYDFDLLYDIKYEEQLFGILRGGPHCTDIDSDIFDLIEVHNIELPEDCKKFCNPIKPFAWLDGNGGYITYPPLPSDEHKYTPVYKEKPKRLV